MRTEKSLHAVTQFSIPTHGLPINLGQITNEKSILPMGLTLVKVDVFKGSLKVADDRSRVNGGWGSGGRKDGNRTVGFGRVRRYDNLLGWGTRGERWGWGGRRDESSVVGGRRRATWFGGRMSHQGTEGALVGGQEWERGDGGHWGEKRVDSKG